MVGTHIMLARAHTLLERVFRVVDMRAEGFKSIFWQHEQRQREQDKLEHAIDGIKPGLTEKLFGIQAR
jgi:hypothetical protein